MTPQIDSKIRTSVENFQAAIELLGGEIYQTPDWNSCKVSAEFMIDGVKVQINCVGLSLENGAYYYARNNSWTHVRFEYSDFHYSGKGARSVGYTKTFEMVAELVA